MFKFRPQFFQIQGIDSLRKYDAMWISHRDAGDGIRLICDHNFLGNKCVALCFYRNLFWCKDCFSHVYFRIGCLSVFHGKIYRFDAAFCLDRHMLFFRNIMIVGIFCDTADAVSTHRAFRSVCIVHDHAAVCYIRRSDGDQAVRTDPEMTVTYTDCRVRNIRDCLFKQIYIDIIISGSMHFCKFHTRPSNSST